jgi:hypothetical protein
MIKNKRNQLKTIEKLKLMQIMYVKLQTLNYQEERKKLLNSKALEFNHSFEDFGTLAFSDKVSELRHSSEDFETFETRRSEKLKGLFILYNNINEKLPHHMRLNLLE